MRREAISAMPELDLLAEASALGGVKMPKPWLVYGADAALCLACRARSEFTTLSTRGALSTFLRRHRRCGLELSGPPC